MSTKVQMNHIIHDVKNLEACSLIWFGDSITNELRKQLRTVINYLLVFDDEQQCLQYISSLSKYDQIILIIKRKSSEDFILKTSPLKQIYSIYIYSKNGHSIKSVHKVNNYLNSNLKLCIYFCSD